MTSAVKSLGEFAIRMLGGITPSTWLPATTLVLSGWIIMTMDVSSRPTLFEAVEIIARSDLRTVFTAFALIVFFALLLQPFQFGSIRILEGYWGPWMAGGVLSRSAIWCQRLRQTKLDNRIDNLDPPPTVDGAEPPEPSPQVASAIADIERSMKERFPPDPGRMLPTALGNILRSAEDRANSAGEHIQHALLRDFDDLPESLQTQHDHFRTRLDVYALLTVVWIFLTVWAVRVLEPQQWRAIVVAASSGVFSHRALLHSAFGYGDTLIAISSTLRSQESDNASVVLLAA